MNCNYLVLLVVLQVVELPMTQVNGRLVVPLASIPSEKTCSGKVRKALRNFKSNLNDVLSKLIDIYTVPECNSSYQSMLVLLILLWESRDSFYQ